MLKLTMALFAVCLNCGLYGACASQRQTPPAVAPPAKAALSAAVACRTLTASLEETVPKLQRDLSEKLGGKTNVSITKTQCEGQAMVAELYVTSMVDESYVEAIFVLGMSLTSDGKVEVEVLESKRVEK